MIESRDVLGFLVTNIDNLVLMKEKLAEKCLLGRLFLTSRYRYGTARFVSVKGE